MRRREMLAATGAAVLGLSAFPIGPVAAKDKKKQKVLYFTRSVEYEHPVVAPGPDGLSFSGKILIDLGKKAGFEVEPSKDGRLFDGDLDKYDCLVFYSCGDMTMPAVGNHPPMSPGGKKKLVEAVAAGKPLVAIHSGCYGGRNVGSEDPYVAMVGGSFVAHGAQQEAAMIVASPDFPGAKGLEKSFRLQDEWYAMKGFAEDLHVILVQDTAGMTGDMYQRPPFPATWARMNGKGRVFFTSMGHREDVWTNPIFQQVLLGGVAWAMGNVDADVTPNVDKVTPKASQLKN